VKAVRRSASQPQTEAAQEHEFEAAHGLPEALPKGERLLWQGAPVVGELARRAFHLRKLALYFALLIGSRIAAVIADGGGLAQAIQDALLLSLLAGVALAIVYTLAWLSARTTVYTITNRRVVMRIGIVLSVTFNLPYSRLAAAGLHGYSAGTGDIPLQLEDGERIAWLQIWPHVRPWRVKHTEPMLRCIADASAVSKVLAQAWSDARRLPLPEEQPERQLERPSDLVPAAPKAAPARIHLADMPANVITGAARG
jgi:Bacterial PH domain